MEVLKSVLKKEGFTPFGPQALPLFFKDFEVYKIFVYFKENDEVRQISIELLDEEIELFIRHTYDYPEVEPCEKTMKDWLYSILFDMAMELWNHMENDNSKEEIK